MIDLQCPECSEPMSVPSSLAGQTEPCPKCGCDVVVPVELAVPAKSSPPPIDPPPAPSPAILPLDPETPSAPPVVAIATAGGAVDLSGGVPFDITQNPPIKPVTWLFVALQGLAWGGGFVAADFAWWTVTDSVHIPRQLAWVFSTLFLWFTSSLLAGLVFRYYKLVKPKYMWLLIGGATATGMIGKILSYIVFMCVPHHIGGHFTIQCLISAAQGLSLGACVWFVLSRQFRSRFLMPGSLLTWAGAMICSQLLMSVLMGSHSHWIGYWFVFLFSRGLVLGLIGGLGTALVMRRVGCLITPGESAAGSGAVPASDEFGPAEAMPQTEARRSRLAIVGVCVGALSLIPSGIGHIAKNSPDDLEFALGAMGVGMFVGLAAVAISWLAMLLIVLGRGRIRGVALALCGIVLGAITSVPVIYAIIETRSRMGKF